MNSIFSTAFTRCPIVNLTKTAAFIASAVNWSYSYKVDVTQCAFAATIRKTALKNLASRGVFCFYAPLIRFPFVVIAACSLRRTYERMCDKTHGSFLCFINCLSATRRCVCINFIVDQKTEIP